MKIPSLFSGEAGFFCFRLLGTIYRAHTAKTQRVTDTIVRVPFKAMLEIVEKIRQEIEQVKIDSNEALESFRVNYLGRKSGRITDLFKKLKEVPADQRRAFGQHVNALKELAESRLEGAKDALTPAGRVQEGDIDLTLPGRQALIGSMHPLTQTFEEIQRIFCSFGFSVAEGPEIEDDWHNFTALNFPPDHPARDI